MFQSAISDTERTAELSSEGNRALRVRDIFDRLTVKANALPQFQVQQPPDAVSMIAMTRAVLREQPLHDPRFELSSIQGSRLQQHVLQGPELRPRQPVGPRRRESHLLPADSLSGEQILDR